MLSRLKLPNKYCNKLLKKFEYYTHKVDDIRPYKCGFSPKNRIYYTDTELICTESHLKYIGVEFEDNEYVEWKQHIIEIDNDNYKPKVRSDLSGTLATNAVIKALYKAGYTKETIAEALNSKIAEYDYSMIQYHNLNFGMGLNKFENCWYYDINGAHNDALCEIFVDAKDYFTNLFNERHTKPNNKKIANYFVGNLVNTGFKNTYNWIVQRTTTKILDLIDKTDGTIVYANTDGFITQKPVNLLETNDLLGGVKLEAPEDSVVYTYRDRNYFCIQYTDIKTKAKIIKGSLPLELRNLIDLEKGKVIHFDRVKNNFGRYEYQNIIEEIIKE